MAARLAVCLHGFLRTGASMLPVRLRLRREGWSEVQTPTWRYELADLPALGRRASDTIRALSDANDGAPIDVVTHSMGGLVIRAALAHGPPVGRIVMLAPPNNGARMAQKVRKFVPVHLLGWDPLAPLQPGATEHLPTGDAAEIGVLTGGRGNEWGYNPLLGHDNDGKVRIDEALLPGASDFRVMPAHHSFVMMRRPVLDQVVAFLRGGSFDRPQP